MSDISRLPLPCIRLRSNIRACIFLLQDSKSKDKNGRPLLGLLIVGNLLLVSKISPAPAKIFPFMQAMVKSGHLEVPVI